MATFPTPPGRRFAYDVDGTVVTFRRLTQSYTLTPANLAVQNDENNDAWQNPFVDGGNPGYQTWLFPELRNIAGFYYAGFNGISRSVQTSTDTTTGVDGTWLTVLSSVTEHPNLVATTYRNDIQLITANNTGVKGLRYIATDINAAASHQAIHIYGSIVTPAGLDFWDPASDVIQAFADFDLGDRPLGSVFTRTFRVKNRHATLTANNIVLSATDVSTTMAVEFSIGGGAYATTLNIGGLAAGAISGVITLRRTVPTNATVRAQAMRLAADATSWT